ncbi:MAG: DUF4251 domain-containing protein [Prolixibacteraceae bacterium]|nr:DUF4251 domain-containing protein [Prolixibacteraceae bacterium]
MKHLFLIAGIILLSFSGSLAQDKKAEKEAASKAQFDKAIAAIDAKDCVIIVDTYEAKDGTIETNTDVANFLSYEGESIFLQGAIVAGNNATNKLSISDFSKTADKKGNVKVEMQCKGSLITAKIEISIKKSGNYADVIITPTKGDVKRFSGEVISRPESKYFKRPGVI